MSNFKIGQKVVCIDADGTYGLLSINHIYTVKDFHILTTNNGIILEEVKSNINMDGSFKSSRFRLLDHQFAEDVIAHITELELQTV